MLGDFGVKTILKTVSQPESRRQQLQDTHPLNQADEHVPIPSVAANKAHVFRHASIRSLVL
jgi:hypothetical protein